MSPIDKSSLGISSFFSSFITTLYQHSKNTTQVLSLLHFFWRFKAHESGFFKSTQTTNQKINNGAVNITLFNLPRTKD